MMTRQRRENKANEHPWDAMGKRAQKGGLVILGLHVDLIPQIPKSKFPAMGQWRGQLDLSTQNDETSLYKSNTKLAGTPVGRLGGSDMSLKYMRFEA